MAASRATFGSVFRGLERRYGLNNRDGKGTNEITRE